ncbi:MAG: lytic transglycosylase [Desulfobacteraceae bacterium]|nr:MAG: lytic transglycosylase [Desulfobacteraceae bacterium]
MKKNSCLLFSMVLIASLIGPFHQTFAAEKKPGVFVEPCPLPRTMALCGEKVPLENPPVLEMLDREIHITVWDQAKVLLTFKRAARHFPFIEKRLKELGMPDDLKYLSVAESNLLTYARSSAGALGPWQFMQGTGVRVGLRHDPSMDERLDFERSTEAALLYLRQLRDMFGSWAAAMGAYNCGENRIRTEMSEQRVTDFYRLNLPLETERYIFRIAAIKLIMENPERYGFRVPKETLYGAVRSDSVPLNIRQPVHIADLAEALGTDYKEIKELNPQILGRFLPEGQYVLKIPAGTASKLERFLKSLPPVQDATKNTPEVMKDKRQKPEARSGGK